MRATSAAIELAMSASAYTQQCIPIQAISLSTTPQTPGERTPLAQRLLAEMSCVDEVDEQTEYAAAAAYGGTNTGRTAKEARSNFSSSSTTTTEDSAIFGSVDCNSGVTTPNRRDSTATYTPCRGYIQGRRHTINKIPLHRYNMCTASGQASLPPGPTPSSCRNANPGDLDGKAQKKDSIDSQFLDYESDEDAEFYGDGVYGRTAYHRRFSVPEKTLRKANYAILRKSVDEEERFEIIGAFQRCTTDAYKEFLQSLSCYDLAPQHGVIVMLDSRLSVHKALSIMCLNPGHKAAIVSEAGRRVDDVGVFTITDCLYILQLVSSDEYPDGRQLSEQSLHYYLENIQPRRQLVLATSSMTAWDVARLFRLNKVHRIPVLQVDDAPNRAQQGQSEICSFVCLRSIFQELIKLLDSKCALVPDLQTLTLEQARLGTWEGIATLGENATVREAVRQFIARKAPCLPILADDPTGSGRRLIGVVSKSDVIEAIAERPNGYLEVLGTAVKSTIQMEKSCREMSIEPSATIENAVRRMVGECRTCLFVVREGAELEGAISLADIMDYLLSCSGI